jgi:hypothetical protein
MSQLLSGTAGVAVTGGVAAGIGSTTGSAAGSLITKGDVVVVTVILVAAVGAIFSVVVVLPDLTLVVWYLLVRTDVKLLVALERWF